MNILDEARRFVQAQLNSWERPESDRCYRWEHTLRVAAIGREIAEREGLDAEALELGCLLHDVGYAVCRTEEEYIHHGPISARIAEEFLKEMGYDPEKTEAIRYGIWTHTEPEEDCPRPMTAFEQSIADADDIDRFGALRMANTLDQFDLMQQRPSKIVETCGKMIDRYTAYCGISRGTKTAQALWRDRLEYQISYYRRLLEQMKSGM